jgi:hypothetical protein
MFWCKQRTYNSSGVNNGRIFDAKLTQIKAQNRPKTAFYLASKRSLGAEKAVLCQPNRGLDELRICPAGHYKSAAGGDWLWGTRPGSPNVNDALQ